MSHNEAMAGMNNLDMSEKAKPLLAAVIKHIRENVDPMTDEFFRLGEGREDRWSYAPGQLELLEEAKQKARDAGLWNFFLPNAETGEGLSNLDYAYIAAELGKSPGGDIFIHGQKTAQEKNVSDWTWGCIAVSNKDIEDIYSMVGDNTPIAINS